MADGSRPLSVRREKKRAAKLPLPGDAETRGYEKGRATRRHIVKIASREFARNGFKATSVDQISAAAGMTKGAVSGHFPRKRDLFIACMQHSLRFFDELGPYDPGVPAEKGLQNFVAWLGSHLSAHSDARSFLIQLMREVDDQIRVEMIRSVLTEPFRQLRGYIEGVNPRLDSAAFAFLIFSQLLLDADQHFFYTAMAGESAAAHNMDATIRRLVAVIRTAKER